MNKQLLSKLAFSTMLATSLVIVGCGGGGGGEEENITVITDADWVAYQDDSGVWHHLTNVSSTEDGNEVLTYTFKIDKKYGVAFYCVDNEDGQVFHLTKNETKSVSYYCGEHGNRYSVSGTFANLEAGRNAYVFIDSRTNTTLLSKAQDENTWSVSDIPEGTWDIVGVEFSLEGENVIPERAAINRDVEVNGDVAGEELNFVDNSLVDYAFNVIDGESQGFGVSYFVTKNNTLVLNGRKDKDETTGTWYKIQNIDLIDGDSYIFIGLNSDESKIRIEPVEASTASKSAKNMDLGNITPLTSGNFDPNTEVVSGLNYNPTGDVTNLIGYDVSIGDDVDWDIFISKEWLGDDTSYTLPDFSGVEGFDNTWWFANLESTSVDVELSAIMSEASLKGLLNPDVRIEGSIPILKSAEFEMVTQELQ